MKIIIYGLLFLLISCQTSPNKKEVANYEILSDFSAHLGEAPFWHEKEKLLYWIDIIESQLFIYNPADKQTKKITLPSFIGTVVPVESGGLLVALKDGIYFYDTSKDSLHFIVNPEPDKPQNRLNDGKCDAAGRFWVGSVGKNQTGGLYCLELDGTITKKLDSVTVSNGIVWTSDNQTMYYVDSPKRSIQAFDFDLKTGKISNHRIAVSMPDSLGYPDGMAIDIENNVWVGHWYGKRLGLWNPKTAKMEDEIVLPALEVTACSFGSDLQTLYITTARKFNEDTLRNFPESGKLFAAKAKTKGTHFYTFKGDMNFILKKK